MRVKISVTIDEELIKWAKEMVKTRKYRSVSHVIEYALDQLRKTSR